MQNRWPSLGKIGSFLTAVLAILSTNWVAAMSAAITLFVWIADWARAVALSPVAQAMAGVFLFCLWTGIGLSYLARRRKPLEVQVKHDLAHGIWFEGFSANYDPKQIALNIILRIRNVTPLTLRLHFEKLDIVISNRTLAGRDFPVRTIILQRHAMKGLSYPTFQKQDIGDFMGQQVLGFAEFSMRYGVVGSPYTRRLRGKLKMFIALKEDGFGFSDALEEEVDELILVPIDSDTSASNSL